MIKVKTKKIKAAYTKETLDKANKTREDFLQVYFNHHCHIQASCQTYGIGRSTFYDWYKKYPDFKAKCDDVQTELRGLVDDATIKLLQQAHPETVKDVRRILKGSDKFPTGRFIKYSLKNLNTLEDIKAARLRALDDFGDGVIDQDAVETINRLLDSLVNNIVANEGSKDINEAKVIIAQIKAKENG